MDLRSCSKFFNTLANLLGVKHRISSAKSQRTNGLAEQLVKKVSNLLKNYASDDQSTTHYHSARRVLGVLIIVK